MRSVFSRLIPVLAIMLFLITPRVTHAASVTFDDRTEQGVIVTHSGFSNVVLTYPTPESAHFEGDWFTATPLAPNASAGLTVDLLDPNTQDVSDTIDGVFTGLDPATTGVNLNMHVSLDFLSDGETPLSPPRIALNRITETGGIQGPFGVTGIGDFVISFASDVETTTVPSPAASAGGLVLLALAGVGRWMKRRV